MKYGSVRFQNSSNVAHCQNLARITSTKGSTCGHCGEAPHREQPEVDAQPIIPPDLREKPRRLVNSNVSPHQMHISPEPAAQDVISLLEACTLPVADIAAAGSAVQFFGVRSGSTLVAVVGLELYPPVGLLRSLAVMPSFRGRGFARALVGFAESFAASQGVGTLFLLTTTAEHFFLALGYAPASRGAAPKVIQTTVQFASLCPASSAFLSKHIAAAG